MIECIFFENISRVLITARFYWIKFWWFRTDCADCGAFFRSAFRNLLKFHHRLFVRKLLLNAVKYFRKKLHHRYLIESVFSPWLSFIFFSTYKPISNDGEMTITLYDRCMSKKNYAIGSRLLKAHSRSETVFGNWQPFKNDEKCFVFLFKGSLRSQDIKIFI